MSRSGGLGLEATVWRSRSARSESHDPAVFPVDSGSPPQPASPSPDVPRTFSRLVSHLLSACLPPSPGPPPASSRRVARPLPARLPPSLHLLQALPRPAFAPSAGRIVTRRDKIMPKTGESPHCALDKYKAATLFCARFWRLAGTRKRGRAIQRETGFALGIDWQ